MVTIYKLYCIHTKEAYIGCTSGKLGKRMREHRCLLNKGRHKARRMQDLWNEHGSAGFRLESLESLPKFATVIDKRKREIFWMEHYDKQGMLLNHCKASYAPPEGAQKLAAQARVANGYRPSAESNEKRSLAQKGKSKPKHKKAGCTNCDRIISLSKMREHLEACKRKSGNDIVSSAIKKEVAGASDKELRT